MYIFAQLIGILAFVLYVYSIQKKNKKQILIYQMIANLLYALEYFILGATVSCILSILMVTRCYIYNLYKKDIPIYIPITYIILIVVIALLTSNDIISIVPVLINILYVISTWQNNTKIIKVTFSICGLLWILYNYNVGAYTMIIGNVFEVISGVYSLYKVRKMKNDIIKK